MLRKNVLEHIKLRETHISIYLCGVVLFWSIEASAQRVLPDTDEKCINDHAEVVTNKDRKAITSLCKKASKEEVDMMIVTVKDLENFRPRVFNVDRFVTDLFDEWNVGYEEKGNAIFLFVSLKEREFRILVGEHYQDRLREKAGRIVKQTLVPAFRRRKHSSGVRGTFSRLFREVAVPHIRALKKAKQQVIQVH